MFRDRHEAGRELAEELGPQDFTKNPVVYGIPRGGVIVGAEVAERLGLPLDVLITSKVGAPSNPEYAIGAVDPDGVVSANIFAGYGDSELEHLARATREKIAHRAELYRAGRDPIPPVGRRVIIVDDGIATGLTVIAAVEYVQRHGALEVVVAAPVSSPDAARRIRELSW